MFNFIKGIFKKKYLIILLALLLLTSFALAEEITVSPASINITMLKTESRNVNFTIFNNINYAISNLIIDTSNLPFNFQYPTLTSISSGGVLNVNSQLSCKDRGTFNSQIPIRGSFNRNATSSTPAIYNITVKSDGTLDSYNLNILKGDTVIFRNNYISSINLNVYSNSLTLMSNTPVAFGSSVSQIFTTSGTYSFSSPSFTGGTIIVNDNINVIVSSYLNVALKCQEQNTSIDVEILEPANRYLNISYNNWGQVALKISNPGSNDAIGLNYNIQWGKFSSPPLVINKNAFQIVVFNIIPEISDTAQTGKTYTKTLTISGDNIVSKTIDFSIFIPYAEVSTSGGNISSSAYWVQRMAFCNSHPTSPDCLTAPIIQFQNKTIYQCPPTETNFTSQEVRDQMLQCGNLRQDFQAAANIVKGTVDGLTGPINNMSSTVSSNSVTLNKNDKRVDSLFAAVFYGACVAIFVIICCCAVALAIKFKKNKDRKELRRF